MSAVIPVASRANSLLPFMLRVLSRVLSFGWLRPGILFAWDDTSTIRSSGTSWLDGLRGVASLQVFFFHYFCRYTPWGRSFGSSPEDRYIHQLPFFRSIWAAGSSAVCIFFVISGYAVSVKSLTLLRQKRYDELYKGLCSSLIRRGFRLYLPLILLAIPMLFLIRIFDMERDGYIYSPEVMSSWYKQFVHLFTAIDDHLNPFMDPAHNPASNRFAYIPPSWTIPIEYQASIVIYVLVMILSRTELFRTRCIILGGMALYSLHRGAWWTSNFIVGMLLADCILEQQSRASKSTARGNKTHGITRNACFFMLFGFGFYLAGIPPEHLMSDLEPKPKPGYDIFYKLYPSSYIFQGTEEARWWWYWSGTFTVISISQLSSIRTILNTKFCQWLGKLSFSLYLIHAAVIGALITPLDNFISPITTNKALLALSNFCILAPIIFALSGVVEKYIDRPSVRFAKKVETYLWFEQPLRPLGEEEIPLTPRDGGMY